MTPKEVMQNLDQEITGSSYFTWGEALWMKSSDAYAFPSHIQIANIISLARALEPVRKHFNAPFIVNSWLRTAAHNKLIGGGIKSAHLEGLAIDFGVQGKDVHKCREELMNNKSLWPYRGEVGVPWLHLDLKGDKWFYP